MFSIFIEEDVLQGLLDVDSLLQVFQESVQVDDVLVDALKHLVEAGQYLKVVLTKLLITILEFLFNRNKSHESILIPNKNNYALYNC